MLSADDIKGTFKNTKKEWVMDTNRNWAGAWDRTMMAITFAEAGEHETARELLAEKQKECRPTTETEKREATGN